MERESLILSLNQFIKLLLNIRNEWRVHYIGTELEKEPDYFKDKIIFDHPGVILWPKW